MVLRKLMGIFTITLIVCAASLAFAGVPNMADCSASSAAAGFAVVMNVPNGNGNSFLEAYPIISVGPPLVFTDATISVLIQDAPASPIANYPFEDIWLESVTGGNVMVACTGGATADASTDALGMTQFQTPLQAGGWSQANTLIMVNGLPIPGLGVAVGFNSPDFDGNGTVNLSDVATFAGDFNDNINYWFRSDLFNDGDVNLSDLPKLAASFGASCP